MSLITENKIIIKQKGVEVTIQTSISKLNKRQWFQNPV
jgi:hypothetical protein